MSRPVPAELPRIVHRDAHLLVLEKPVGIATTAPDDGPSLFAQARLLDPRAPQLHPLSRLDTQVSGLVTFARTARANEHAIAARRAGSLRRAYLGICSVSPAAERGSWHHAIGFDPRDPARRRALPPNATGGGVKKAETRYVVHAQAGVLFALDLWPVTGRTHQLRVHASAAGCALAGDTAYGGSKRITLPNGRVLTAGRCMLHCSAFRMPDLDDPTRILRLTLAPPEDLLRLWRAAGGDPAALDLTIAD